MMRASGEGGLAGLFDIMPAPVLARSRPGDRLDAARQSD